MYCVCPTERSKLGWLRRFFRRDHRSICSAFTRAMMPVPGTSEIKKTENQPGGQCARPGIRAHIDSYLKMLQIELAFI